jgi:two-component system LytT family response regulator
MNALIVDDELPARAALRGLIARHPGVTLVGEADSVERGRELLQRNDYDLVFLDVQLRGGSGFELLPLVRPEARIVFVTAFDQHAVRAFEVNALDYLLKPVSPDRFAAALRRAEAGSSGDTAPTAEPASPAASHYVAHDLVHLKLGNGATRFVHLEDIAAIEADGNYSAVQLADGARYFVRRTMKAWEDVLPASHFIRVHRSAVINLAWYAGSDRQSDETTFLHLRGLPQPVRASFRYLAELRARLAQLGKQL